MEKLRKKISELESELLLYLPQLKFSFYTKNNPNKVYTFFLSSEYERTTWIEAIKRMQLSGNCLSFGIVKFCINLCYYCFSFSKSSECYSCQPQ